jgi:hypothetical protein
MDRRVVWILGAALGLAMLATPASAQVGVAVGVGTPGFGASVVFGGPPVYVVDPYFAPHAVPYPYYYTPYYNRYPIYGRSFYPRRGYYYGGRAPYYNRGYAPRYGYGPRYYGGRVPYYYRGVGAINYPDPRVTGRTYVRGGYGRGYRGR